MSEEERNYHIETKCQLKAGAHQDAFGSLSVPIYQTATFEHRGIRGVQHADSCGFDYTRVSNPTREQLEAVMALLEGGNDAMAFSTGMAAIDVLMELFQPGDHIIVDGDLYGGSTRLFDLVNRKNGLTFTAIDFSEDDVCAAIRPQTKALYLETPTNPMMHVTDLAKVSRIAREHGLLLIVDNTFLSPYFQNPIALGADIVIHSATKYLGGHNDTLGGFLVTGGERGPELSAKLRELYKTIGSCLSPFDSWLILRGIKTLAVRMDRVQENAMKIAGYLKTNPHVTRVLYPGLPEHPGYEIMKRQARGFGGMLTFEVESTEFAVRVLNHVELIHFAESLGGTETLLTYPITQTHADVPKELLEKNGLTDRVLRLSVGIENADDLIEEFERVFAAAEKE